MMRSQLAAPLVLLLAGALGAACGGSGDAPPVSGTTGGGAGADGGGSGGSGGLGGSGGAAGSAGAAGAAGAGGNATVCPPDADGDNIPDDIEGAPDRDTDQDGTPDYLDTDSDDDTIPDRLEADTANQGCRLPADSDQDGTPNYLDDDSDNNGLSDRDEIYPDGSEYDPSKGMSDIDNDAIPDAYDPDNDGDTLDDVDEFVNGAPVDTDSDGFADHNDLDADDDGIADGYETTADADNDGIPNFRDADSDGDSVSDACEGGFGHILTDPPADSDRDGTYDFIDIDADNDGLKDGLEDKNFNCIVDPGESDRTLADSDGDGVNDLIEVKLGSDPTGPGTPEALGKYYFVMPYNSTPEPAEHHVVLKTNLNKGDIGFVVDTTGSMSGAINSIKTNLGTIITEVKKDVPDARFGVLAFEEYPVSPYGNSADILPVRLPDSATSNAYLTDVQANTQAALATLTPRDGGDPPEAGVIAMWKALTNGAVTWPPGVTQNAFSPPGGFGALGFQDDALPILVAVTDAPFHNGVRGCTSNSQCPSGQCDLPTTGEPGVCDVACTQNSDCSAGSSCSNGFCTSPIHDFYSFNATQGTPTVDGLITEMNKHGAKFVGISLDNGGEARKNKDPYRDMAHIVDNTGSYVLPSAFGTAGNCGTGIVGLTPDGPSIGGLPSCRLIFSTFADGAGTSDKITKGIKALLSGIQLEVRVLAVPVNDAGNYLVCDPGTGAQVVDPVDDLIEFIEVFIEGNVEDPAEPGTYCETLDINDMRDWYSGPRGVIGGKPPPTGPDTISVPDTHNETATNVTPGTRICYRLKPKTNTLCPQKADVQIAQARLVVKARNANQPMELDVGDPRDVFFVIPPNPQ